MGRVALIYVRQSSHKPGQATVSPEVQEKSCRELPAVAACDQVEVYRDLDVSGGQLSKRRGFLAALERLKGGGVSVIAVYDQSRSFRNTRDALEFYAFVAERPELEVQFVHGRFDRTAIGGFTYTNLAAAHELERRMVAEKMRDALHFLSAQGYAVGHPPYGYGRAGPGLQADLVVSEEEAGIVRRIFRDYATGGWSLRGMARALNREGVPAPAREGWAPETLQDMLGNPAYIGMTYSSSRRRREGELIEARWPALVGLDLWNAVREQGARNRRRPGGHSGIGNSHPYVFSRLLVCAECGQSMYCRNYSKKKNKKYVYYRCRSGDTGTTCDAPSAREDLLLPWAEHLFERIDAVTRSEVTRELERARGKSRRRPEDAIKRIDVRLERITELYAMGHWEKDRYVQERARLEADRRELADLEEPERTLTLDGVLDGWRSGDPVVRRALVAALFEELYVRDRAIVGWKARAERAVEVERLMDEVGSGVAERSA